MEAQDQHTMVLVAEQPDGSQEWHCPTCGRRFIITFEPSYKRIILNEGNFEVIHSGGTNGLSFGQFSIQPKETDHQGEDQDISGELIEIDDAYLAPFKAWMDDHSVL